MMPGRQATRHTHSPSPTEGIEDTAYRHGFPCHTTAGLVKHNDSYGQQNGFYLGENSQHCIGYIITCFKAGYDTWPGIANDEDLNQYQGGMCISEVLKTT